LAAAGLAYAGAPPGVAILGALPPIVAMAVLLRRHYAAVPGAAFPVR
jgi:hypothetical protein